MMRIVVRDWLRGVPKWEIEKSLLAVREFRKRLRRRDGISGSGTLQVQGCIPPTVMANYPKLDWSKRERERFFRAHPEFRVARPRERDGVIVK